MSLSDRPHMKILHVASFTGNIGDNANHMGFRPWFARQCGQEIVWTDLEIREFYWRERQWDDGFAALANDHDLVVIGGGNYFEMWVEDSPTGTSIAISPEIFSRIRKPVLFNALGVDPGQGVPEASLKRFGAFLQTLLASSQYLVTVRNDGALGNLEAYLGKEIAAQVYRIPDGGFFVTDDPIVQKSVPAGRPTVGINIACDMAEVRFPDGGIEGFVNEFADFLQELSLRKPDHGFVFFPHVHHDLKIISDVIGCLSDRLRRTRITVAPYGSGDDTTRRILATYRQCDLVLAMRFHANVCAMALGCETLGLCNYPQIHNLYDELEQNERCIDLASSGFGKKLLGAAVQALDHPEAFSDGPDDARHRVKEMRTDFEPVLLEWLQQNCSAGS